MKKLMMTLVMALTAGCCLAMSTSKIRNHARFLADRMAYELDLTPMQYDDCYEINYDFIRAVSYIMDDVVFGYTDAISEYYYYLDIRNDDLRYIMTPSQYIRFMTLDYFYRPIYSNGRGWDFRIYTTYSNRKFFYFDAPSIFKTYKGGHGRNHYNNGFYVNRYQNQGRYMGSGRIIGNAKMNDMRRSDFGSNMKKREPAPNYNNYKNPNQDNRTQDRRYRDNSGNVNSPQINNRGGKSGGAPQPSAQPSSRPQPSATGGRGTNPTVNNKNAGQRGGR